MKLIIFVYAIALFYLVDTVDETDFNLNIDLSSLSIMTNKQKEEEEEKQLHNAMDEFQQNYYNLAEMTNISEDSACNTLYAHVDILKVNLIENNRIVQRNCKPLAPRQKSVMLEKLNISHAFETRILPCDCDTHIIRNNETEFYHKRIIYITKISSHTRPKKYFVLDKNDDHPGCLKVIAQKNV